MPCGKCYKREIFGFDILTVLQEGNTYLRRSVGGGRQAVGIILGSLRKSGLKLKIPRGFLLKFPK